MMALCDEQLDEPRIARSLEYLAANLSAGTATASAQVFPDGATGCRFVWIADLLPNEMAPPIAAMIEQGIAVIKDTLERTERARAA